MSRLFTLAAVLLASLALQVAGAKDDPEADETKFVRLTQQLEDQPLSDTDKSIRSWLLQWATDVDDITVVVCDILGTASGDELPHSAIYTTQMIFGNAAYQISHPSMRGDLLATQLAAARSSLKAYNSILVVHPDARIPHFDDLINIDKAGGLEKHMAPVVAEKCSDSGEA